MNTYDFIVRTCVVIVAATILYVTYTTVTKADVRSACQNDYLAYCSHTEPFSQPCRACMRSVGRKHMLSPGCVAALKAAGEVTQADIKAAKK